jgi:hypothetical protein
VSFDAMGLSHLGFRTDLGDYPHGLYGRDWMAKVPWVALTVGGLAVGIHYLNKRRADVQAQEHKEE